MRRLPYGRLIDRFVCCVIGMLRPPFTFCSSSRALPSLLPLFAHLQKILYRALPGYCQALECLPLPNRILLSLFDKRLSSDPSPLLLLDSRHHNMCCLAGPPQQMLSSLPPVIFDQAYCCERTLDD